MDHLEQYGYLALALLVLLEGIGIPTPAVSVVVASAVLAGHGHLSLLWVVVITFAAAVAGDNLGYLIGRKAGRPAILRWGRRVGLTERRFARAEGFLARRGRNIVLIARFIDGLRQTNGLIAGAVAMPWPHYTVRDAIGGVAWTALWVTVGAVAGNNLGRVHTFVRHYEIEAALIAAAVVGLLLLRYFIRKRSRNS